MTQPRTKMAGNNILLPDRRRPVAQTRNANLTPPQPELGKPAEPPTQPLKFAKQRRHPAGVVLQRVVRSQIDAGLLMFRVEGFCETFETPLPGEQSSSESACSERSSGSWNIRSTPFLSRGSFPWLRFSRWRWRHFSTSTYFLLVDKEIRSGNSRRVTPRETYCVHQGPFFPVG